MNINKAFKLKKNKLLSNDGNIVPYVFWMISEFGWKGITGYKPTKTVGQH